ncbi:extracellular protease inhibitor 10-like [Branchiostoma floridae]|uniref:Extracellular protease inhibitor 10-like n=1 Tax=Branchiostoma floridae TaxID=7739 RepID=A0A9J7HJZ9_BRAFL|nr:extracellular protease inhibitor 10-like [Branchiostoma floridae]
MVFSQVIVLTFLVAGCQAKSLVARQGLLDPYGCLMACPLLFDPVCGSDGITYSSPCHLDEAACQLAEHFANRPDYKPLTMASEAPCTRETQDRKRQFDSDCPMYCPEYYSPICGSNGQTYSNICFLQMAACVSAANDADARPIVLWHPGGCNADGSVMDLPLLS